MKRPPPKPTPFPSPTLFRSKALEREARNLDFAWRVVKHVKSNAIVLADNGCTVGVGAGQMSRVDPVKISIQIGRHKSELQSREKLVCRLPLEKKKKKKKPII